MYGDFLKEYHNKEILETDKGYLTYQISNNECYVTDIYVKPEFRRSHAAFDLADEITIIAKERGCTKLVGSVVPSFKGSTENLKGLFLYGFRLQTSAPDFIIVVKDIGE